MSVLVKATKLIRKGGGLVCFFFLPKSVLVKQCVVSFLGFEVRFPGPVSGSSPSSDTHSAHPRESKRSEVRRLHGLDWVHPRFAFYLEDVST